MQTQKNVLGKVDLGGKVGRAAPVGVDRTHQSPVRGTNGLGVRSRFKAQDLVGLVFAHAARIRRAGAPRSRALLMVFSPSGKRAVQVRL